MKLLFTLPAPTIYDTQGRVLSWKHTPTSRDSLRQMRGILSRLKELGVTKVISSDLDSDTGKYLAHKLDIKWEEWPSLRRLNGGKLHGSPLSRLAEVIASIGWEKRPDVPIKGGDSRTSYNKRIEATKSRISKLEGTPLIVCGSREIGAILNTDATLEPYRIYEVEIGQSPKAAVA